MINNNSVVPRLVLCSLIACLCAATALTPSRGDEDSARQAKLNGGYYLLHQLGGDENQLPLLLDMKHAPPELVTYADQISKAGKETVASLEHFQDRDKAIQLDRNPLPQIEQDVRDSIKADKQHQLLFGTSNSDFVRALLISQIEASTYAIHLSKVLADGETNPGRAKKLRQLSARWLGLRDDAYRILRNY
jgi:hypothetical protein